MTETSTEAESGPKPFKKPKGRISQFAGKVLRAAVPENPRRPGSRGHDSFQLLLDHPDGMTYEEFATAGGRPNDLMWDFQRERVTASDS